MKLVGPQELSGRVRKISPPTGIRFPDRPARSESLYRLSYPSPGEENMALKFPWLCPLSLLVQVGWKQFRALESEGKVMER